MVCIDLTGKVAVVTGGGQGIGAAIVRALHRAGASVAVNFLPDTAGSNRERARQLVGELGDRCEAFPADVRELQQMQSMFTSVIDHFKRCDILVNNAGILRDRTIKKMSQAEWQDVMDTNLTGVFNACKAAAETLADGGRIVSISSIAASVGFFGQSNYAAAKAGVSALTRVLSRELASRRINVNAVAPGVVLTEMGQSIPPEARAQMLTSIPLGRFGEVEEIAGAVLLLCSELASYITGQTIHVNGGWYA